MASPNWTSEGAAPPSFPPSPSLSFLLSPSCIWKGSPTRIGNPSWTPPMARPSLAADLLLPSFIYGGEGHPKGTTVILSRVRCPPPQFTTSVILSYCLGEAQRGSHHQHHHHAIVLTELSLDPLLDQELEGHHRAERVQNSEVPYVRRLIGWIMKTFDYINRVKLPLPLSAYEGT